MDSTGVGALIRLRKRSRELNHHFFLVAPRPQFSAALKLMKLDEFFTIQASTSGVRILMESAAGAAPVTSDVQEKELQHPLGRRGDGTQFCGELGRLYRIRTFPGHARDEL